MINKPFRLKQLYEDSLILNKYYDYFSKLDWQSDTYKIHGKSVTPKRMTYMYGLDYSYSGIKKKSFPFDNMVKSIASDIENSLSLKKGYFNACLCNYYPDGTAGISYHKDDEREMDKSAVIVSLSLGQARKFYLKNDKTKEVEKIILESGEILVMSQQVQDEWQHSIPKEPKVMAGRISLTFRKFVN